MIDCMNKEQRVTPELDKRVFSISGGALDRLNLKQIMEWCDNNASTPGCVYYGCSVIMGEFLWIMLDGQEILCFMCKGSQPVDAQEGCPDHPETKLEYLTGCALGQVAKW